MGPLGHTVASLGIGGAVWAATGSALAVPAAAAGGVLVDSDHLVDFFNWYVRKDRRRVMVLFHGWEYAAVGLALVLGLWYHPALLAVALGYLGHVVGDHIANKPLHPLAYSILFRASRGFHRRGLFEESAESLSEALHQSIPLWGVLELRLLAVASWLGLRRSVQ